MSKKARNQLEKALMQKNACYILITCGDPTQNGDMQVEMTYEGDATLASFLLQGAQTFIDNEERFA
ncbi:MAG: hypothetical protein LW832_03995 [Parachlamydia sp.]|jgi:hypothetical protein|nr:hypothetical protein [Parachlamydia sp.]